jgi:hypothetical protein
VWDEQRGESIVMTKPHPSTGSSLQVRGRFAASRSVHVDVASRPKYELEFADGTAMALEDVQWADWSRDGQLVVATIAGELQIRDGDEVPWRYDTSQDVPHPLPAPASAMEW